MNGKESVLSLACILPMVKPKRRQKDKKVKLELILWKAKGIILFLLLFLFACFIPSFLRRSDLKEKNDGQDMKHRKSAQFILSVCWLLLPVSIFFTSFFTYCRRMKYCFRHEFSTFPLAWPGFSIRTPVPIGLVGIFFSIRWLEETCRQFFA